MVTTNLFSCSSDQNQFDYGIMAILKTIWNTNSSSGSCSPIYRTSLSAYSYEDEVLPRLARVSLIHCVFPQASTFKIRFFRKNKGTFGKVQMFHTAQWKKQTPRIKTSVLRCGFSQPVQCFSLQQMLVGRAIPAFISMGFVGEKNIALAD